MHTTSRIEPPAEVLDAVRGWLAPVRAALGNGFLSAYVTGSVLTTGWDAKHSHVNVLVFARALAPDTLDALAAAAPEKKRAPHIDAMFMTREQALESLDVFPIEWLDVVERHLLLEGEHVLAGIEVPRSFLRLQCEHELRSKALRLRHEYLASAKSPARLTEVLARMASGFHTLFRTLLRLRGEETPAGTEPLVQRIAALWSLDARALLGAHLAKHAGRKAGADEARARYRAFLVEVERLAAAVDGLRVP